MASRNQSPEDQVLCERVVKAMDIAEPYHQRWRRKANHVHALYHNYQDFKTAMAAASPRGQDEIRRDAASTWGADYFIPMAFGVVETTVPIVVANRPRMLALPRDQLSEPNVDSVQFIIDAQQQQINYELVLQEIGKTGLIYGLGIQKCDWREKFKKRRRLVPSEAPRSDNPSGYASVEMLEKVFDDPVAESIDPFDFFWDPYAATVADADFLVHRSWRTMRYIEQMGQTGKWRNLVDLEVIQGMGTQVRYDEAWSQRMTAMGFGDVAKRGADRLHEVLEFHDGDEVITTLDREICVQAGPNPHWHGEKPFQIYRPTHLPNRFEGKGEIEPIEDLQKEINDLRRARRDNAHLIIQKCFAFHDGMLETDDFKFGPAMGIPTNGDPREILFPIPMGEIPYAGYREEEALKEDFRFTSGMADPSVEGSVQQTATGAEIVRAAATRRAQNKTRRLELEIIVPGTAQFHCLNQQKILENRTVRIGTPPTPTEPDRRWSWKELGPAELAGEFSWYPEGGTGAENAAQDRSDASQMWLALSNHPRIDQTWLIGEYLKKFGYKHPESALAPPEPKVPPETLDILVNEFKVPKADIAQALGEALKMAEGGAPSPNGNGAPVAA